MCSLKINTLLGVTHRDAPFIRLTCIRSFLYSLFVCLSLTAAIYFHTTGFIYYVFPCPCTCPLTHSCVHVLVQYPFFHLANHANTSLSHCWFCPSTHLTNKKTTGSQPEEKEPHFIIHTNQKPELKIPCASHSTDFLSFTKMLVF